MTVSSECSVSAEPDVSRAQGDMYGGGFPPAAPPLLISVIEGEIIPRLLLAHREHAPNRIAAGANEFFGDGEAVARLFLTADSTDIVTRLHGLADTGVMQEQIYLQLLAPVARTLSILWEEGRISLDDVARGLSCIGQVLHDMQSHDTANTESH